MSTPEITDPSAPLASRVLPSLLDPEPFVRVDQLALARTLAFAFATGDVGDALERVLDDMRLAESGWEPAEFRDDVFLRQVLGRGFAIAIAGHAQPAHAGLLLRLVGAPPADRRVTEFRQTVLAELLGQPTLRSAAEHFYALAVRLRQLLARETLGVRIDAFTRRMQILRTLSELVEHGARAFVDARSGLGRVTAWAESLRSSEGYARIRELLDYEGAASEVDLTLRLGFDGRVRELAVVARRDPTHNRFYRAPWARWWAKLALWLRGDRFSDEELVSRIMDELFDQVQTELVGVFPLIGDLEFYLASLSFHDRAERAGLGVCLPDFSVEHEGRQLLGLFNPLLVDEARRVIPCDLHTRRDDAFVVVTGPNSGGKTRLMQSLALAQALAQAGSFVPARQARLPWASGLFVSLIEHADADQSEGRLGTELARIRRLFERMKPGGLVVVDELCSGTNPTEGEEIFRLVVKLLHEVRQPTFVTTHFLAFAARLQRDYEDLEFLQVELDGLQLPTYQFVPGVASSSLAHRTAERLGVTEQALRTLLRGAERASDGQVPPRDG